MKKDLQILEYRNTVLRNKKNRTRAILVGSSMAVFLLAGASNIVVASAEEVTPTTTASELEGVETVVNSMTYETEALPVVDTDGVVTDTALEAYRADDIEAENDITYPIYSPTLEGFNDGVFLITDDEFIENGIPTDRINLTAYHVSATNDFKIYSSGEQVDITKEFKLYVPTPIDTILGEATYEGGPILVQSTENGAPSGAIYEVDESFYYQYEVEGYTEFYIPMTVDDVDGYTYFIKESNVDTITDSYFYSDVDTDKDGLLDFEEILYLGTDPNEPDTDGDGLSDGDELYIYETEPTLDDSDEDGLNDYDEVITYMSDPYDTDSDNDGLADGVEVNQYNTDPNNPDTNGDGIIDGKDVEKPDAESPKPETLAYTGNTTHVGVIAGTIALALFVIKKVIKL